MNKFKLFYISKTMSSILIRGENKSVKFSVDLTLDQIIELVRAKSPISEITEYPSRDTDPKIIELRKTYPKAYMPWTDEEDAQLQANINLPITQLVSMFQRKDSAIRSRIKHLKH